MNGQLTALCAELGFPREAAEQILSAPEPDSTEIQRYSRTLTDPERFQESANELLARYAESDKTGFSVLKIMLHAALRSLELYRERAIPDSVFLDTMKCFSRFTKEHMESFGRYGFDRGFWVGRQLSLVLFRIGELEYEFTVHEGNRAISVHIPSDADLTPQLLDRSFAEARKFFAQFFPQYADAEYCCDSWLLAPALKELLPADSKIIRFQNRFRVLSCNENADDYKLWVFKNKDLTPEQFPENTSLQRRMKEHVLKGGKVGEALGVLIRS